MCDELVTNQYASAAESGGYEAAVELFLKHQDAAFGAYISDFSGASMTCGLSRPGKPAMESLKKKSLQVFADERLADLRELDCALFAIRESSALLSCPGTDVVEALTVQGCDQNAREEIRMIQQDLMETMRISFEEIDEIMLAYPLHKQMECLHEVFTDQRKKLIELFRIFAAVVASFPAGQSQ